MKNGLSLCIQGTPDLLAPSYAEKRFIPVYTGNSYEIANKKETDAGLSLCIQGTL